MGLEAAFPLFWFLNDFWADFPPDHFRLMGCAFQATLMIRSLLMCNPSSFAFSLSMSQRTRKIQALRARLDGSGLELGKTGIT